MQTENTRTGALSPLEAAQSTFETALHHLNEPTQLAFFKNVFGALLLSFGGIFALIVSQGSPGLEETNPGLPKMLMGATFPVGLVLIYFVGAELFTGYPMWLAMLAFSRRGRPIQYLRALVIPWLGNLAGALLVSSVFSVATQTLTPEPYKSGIISLITSTVIHAKWHVILLKAIGCGYLVTLAMFVGSQNQDGISKALGLHLPFFISTAIEFPHTVEYMYLGSLAMMLGAEMSVWMFFWKCLLPVTLGNIIGGALFTGAYLWWVYLYCEDGERAKDWLLSDGQQDM
ncbi:Formate/nitrite transporter [Massariosphaeria phaeospora]|uniref:Formate/nitrite transporter n=1 Tax=Massariosphaeria phaeospora TaxID=100035 RepID=A0A7C8ICG0_9PLEO|nr:Formate/nitrite transporter [Massariosphaeria phaeospora]